MGETFLLRSQKTEEKNPRMAVVNSAKVDQPLPANLGTKTSLYVGDLDERVSSMDLFHAFSQIGKVSSVHLCVDVLTGDSLRYGYVNFLSPVDASRALSLLNHTKLRGKPMRIMWCQRNPYTRRAGVTNLFVKNLDPAVTSNHLESMFKVFGNILSCKVAEEDGKSKCFGFVHFEDEASVAAAVNAIHDKIVGGKKLYVARFMSKSQRIAANDEKYTNLYVKNLDENLTDENLTEKFSEFGTVSNAVIIRDGEGKSKGFGFISFESHEEAKKAVESLNGAQFGSKELYVGRAQKKVERTEILKSERMRMKILEDRARASNVYVKNLHLSVDDTILAEHFSPCGHIVSAKVTRDDKGVNKGFGFVRFSSPSEARVALLTLQGSILHGKPLFLGIAQEKLERRRELQKCSYFMPFSCQGAKPFESMPPFVRPLCNLGEPSRQKTVDHGFRGWTACDSFANTNTSLQQMDYIKGCKRTFSDLPEFLRAQNLQAGCAESFDGINKKSESSNRFYLI